ncbi:MAG: hypothetical protein EZS28_020539 [Streblomastix strix]|uniref:Uncharacterized protein n=1 Tax=Streblomastix strix TaxID=222440 RepID=A0A5J4VN72_9EUKA|nr:MAG: hypothetical protein EZS28_020539 [Streblomastix strix]
MLDRPTSHKVTFITETKIHEKFPLVTFDLSQANIVNLTDMANRMIGQILYALQDLKRSVGQSKLEEDPRMARIQEVVKEWENRKDIREEEYKQLLRDIENIKTGKDLGQYQQLRRQSKMGDEQNKASTKSKSKIPQNTPVRPITAKSKFMSYQPKIEVSKVRQLSFKIEEEIEQYKKAVSEGKFNLKQKIENEDDDSLINIARQSKGRKLRRSNSSSGDLVHDQKIAKIMNSFNMKKFNPHASIYSSIPERVISAVNSRADALRPISAVSVQGNRYGMKGTFTIADSVADWLQGKRE